MPQNTTITIKDGAATPLDHVFNPSKIDSNGVATFQERVNGVPVGMPTITWSVRAPTKGSPTYKVQGKLVMPKVVTVTGSDGKSVTSVDYENLANVSFVLSERSTKQERKDARVLISNALVNASIIPTVDDLESFW